METSDFDFENLFSLFESTITKHTNKEDFDQLLVAYSGGVDSTALLYFTKKLSKKIKINIKAIHINHNLSKHSKAWEKHCKEFCINQNIPLELKNIKIILKKNDSIEERARQERYKAIYSAINKKTLMLTAHHAEDQAETLLYQLFRGAGVAGLSAMPLIKEIPGGYHVRPFLNINKSTILDIVNFKELKYINDPSNTDTKFSRNYIRKNIIPVIKEKWPSYSSTITRASFNLANAKKLSEDLAEIDMQKYACNNLNRINKNIKKLQDYRLNNILRYWIKANGYRMPSTEQIKSICSNTLNAGDDKTPFFYCKDFEIRRYDNYLEIMKPLKKHNPSEIYKWKHNENLIIPNLEINLSWKDLENKCGRSINNDVEVKFRKSGQSIMLSSKKSLKEYMREKKIAPWNRERTLLVYINQNLEIVWC